MQDLMSAASENLEMERSNLVNNFIKKIEAFLVKTADGVVIPTESFLKVIGENSKFTDKIFVIPNWSQISDQVQPREISRLELGWEPGHIYVVHSGNLGMKQDIDSIIRVVQELNSWDKIHFVVSGDGIRRHELIAGTKGFNNFEFLGLISEEEYPSFLNSADILLVVENANTGQFAFPSKLTSYMKVGGAIIVVSDVDSPATRLINAKSNLGIHVAPSDSKNLSKVIISLAYDKEMREILKKNTRTFATNNLSKEHSKENFSQALQRLGVLIGKRN
jgi:glycosyltransferase involved in cell wall biosynthesis